MTCDHAFDKTTWQPKNTSLSRSLRIVRVNASLVTTFLRENSFSFQSFVKSLTCSTKPQRPDRISVNLKFYHKTLAMNFSRKRFSVWSLWNSQSASNPFGSTALSKGLRERQMIRKKESTSGVHMSLDTRYKSQTKHWPLATIVHLYSLPSFGPCFLLYPARLWPLSMLSRHLGTLKATDNLDRLKRLCESKRRGRGTWSQNWIFDPVWTPVSPGSEMKYMCG